MKAKYVWVLVKSNGLYYTGKGTIPFASSPTFAKVFSTDVEARIFANSNKNLRCKVTRKFI